MSIVTNWHLINSTHRQTNILAAQYISKNF